MKILITSGLASSDVGGPAQYGRNLAQEFSALGHEVRLVSYGPVERVLPMGLRHLYFLLKIMGKCVWADSMLILDTYSVGVPSAVLASLFRVRSVVRVGGDFTWSAYVNRTKSPVTMTEFYQEMPELSYKERVILYFTKFFINRVDFLTFNTEWQRSMWSEFYAIPEVKTGVTRNFIPPHSQAEASESRTFLWAGRAIPEKNVEILKKVEVELKAIHPEFKLEVVTGRPRSYVLERLRACHVAMSPAFSDVCPNFIIEAVSYGKPFIMTQDTGLSELYPKGGIYLDPRDEDALIDAMESMLNANMYSRFVEELLLSQRTHSWRDMANEFIDIWKKI